MKNEFRQLKRKIIGRILIILVSALLIGFLSKWILIDGLLQDPFAKRMVQLFMDVFKIGYWDGVRIYQEIFVHNKSTLLTIGFCLLLMFLFYRTLSQFINYFKEIIEGVNQLTTQSEQPIQLSRDLEFMQKTLNHARVTLINQRKTALESEQKKNDLVVYLAHDIRTPLTSVIGYLSLLDEAPDMPKEQQEKYIRTTLEKSYGLENLINELFEITRYNGQAIILEKEKFDLSYMLMQMADEFYPMLAPEHKTIELELMEDMIIYADSNKLARVFNNILKNAIAYSYEETSIKVEAKLTENDAVITFVNQGREIPEQKLNRIFEKFYRMDSARTSDKGGAGLGLAIAKEIVELHGGRISAVSEGEITSFQVVIPK